METDTLENIIYNGIKMHKVFQNKFNKNYTRPLH